MSSLAVKIAAPSIGGFELPVTSMVLVTILLKNGSLKMYCHKIVLAISAITLLSACAEQQQSQQVYVSPLEFKKYNCKQLAKEMTYTSAKYNQLVGQKDDGSALLTTALAAYMVSQRYAFTTNGQEDPQAAYLNAKYEALHQASIEKNCD